MAEIKEKEGFIFNSACQTLVNTVNCDGVMGKGIALEFKLRFPEEMFNQYSFFCEQKQMAPGKLLLYKKSKPWVLNLPTKFHWSKPSKIEYIEKGLEKFATTYKEKGINSIAFPKLGTASGGLDWDIVKQIMYKHLLNLADLYVEIYSFNPNLINYDDKLFENLKNILSKSGSNEFSKYQINIKKLQLVKEKIDSKEINKMYDIQKFKGFGDKTIESIYEIAKNINQDSIVAERVNDYKYNTLF